MTPDPYRCPVCGEWAPVRILAAEHCSAERLARLERIHSMTERKQYRDAATGEWTTEADAEERPAETVSETDNTPDPVEDTVGRSHQGS